VLKVTVSLSTDMAIPLKTHLPPEQGGDLGCFELHRTSTIKILKILQIMEPVPKLIDCALTFPA
jgi:hypothetical protein